MIGSGGEFNAHLVLLSPEASHSMRPLAHEYGLPGSAAGQPVVRASLW